MSKKDKEEKKQITLIEKFIAIMVFVLALLFILLNSTNFLALLENIPFMAWLKANQGFATFFGALFGASVAGFVAVFIFLIEIEHRREIEKIETKERNLKKGKYIHLLIRDMIFRAINLKRIISASDHFIESGKQASDLVDEAIKLKDPYFNPDFSKFFYSENFTLAEETTIKVIRYYESSPIWIRGITGFAEVLQKLEKPIKIKKKTKGKYPKYTDLEELYLNAGRVIKQQAEEYYSFCLELIQELDPHFSIKSFEKQYSEES